jgi:hypothetical protein
MNASWWSLTYGSSAASRSPRSLATSASSTTGALQGCSSTGVFIDYAKGSKAEGSKAYRILDPGTQRVRMTRDVVFVEGRGWT